MKINTITQLIERLKLEDGDSAVTLAINDPAWDYTLYGSLSPLKAVLIRANSEEIGVVVIGGVFSGDSLSTVEDELD